MNRKQRMFLKDNIQAFKSNGNTILIALLIFIIFKIY